MEQIEPKGKYSGPLCATQDMVKRVAGVLRENFSTDTYKLSSLACAELLRDRDALIALINERRRTPAKDAVHVTKGDFNASI